MNEDIFINKIQDVIRLSQKYRSPKFSKFLDAQEQAKLRKEGIFGGVLFGGYEDSERKVFGVFPEWIEPEDEDYLKWKKYMDQYMADLRKLPASTWAGSFIAEAIEKGITSDGAYPKAFATREEVITMCNAAYKAASKS